MPKESSRKTDKAKSGTKPPAAKRRNVKQSDENGSSRRTLVVDVGGSGIKATLLNDLGKAVSERLRRDSPASGMPGAVMDVIIALANEFATFDRIAIGFPGVVINGIVKQAPNLAKEWQGFNIVEMLQARLNKPVRVANDADVQGFGAIAGNGVELVVTLGTGVGTSLFMDGRLVPNLEIGNDKLRNAAFQILKSATTNCEMRRYRKSAKKGGTSASSNLSIASRRFFTSQNCISEAVIRRKSMSACFPRM